MAEIFGIGIDAVEISRMESERISNHAVGRLFHPSEVVQAKSLEGRRRAEYLASRFAAKEAFAKALGTGFRDLVPAEIAVVIDNLGKPSIMLCGKSGERFAEKRLIAHLSISHEGPMAMAFVVLEKCGGKDGQI
jgi:holo-[acyl-carrier protein] synthase